MISTSKEKLIVFSFDLKELKPVHDFIADQLWNDDSILLFQIKGYLQKKFTEKFSMNSLTCFSTKNKEIIEMLKNGVLEDEEENQLMLI